MKLFRRALLLDIGTVRIQCGTTVGLDVEFTAARSYTSEANAARAKVCNLNPQHRGELQAAADKGTVPCSLEAGYGDETHLLYRGEFDYCSVSRSGPDVVTEFTLRDGATLMAASAIAKSYAKDTLVSSVLTDLAAATGLDTEAAMTAIASAQIGGSAVLKRPRHFNGNAYAHLVKACASAGLECSTQNGGIQLVAVGGALTGRATKLTAENGVVGSPTVTPGGKAGKLLKVQCLIQPGLDPGRQIQVHTESVDGSFVVRRVTYHGQTWGTEWYADVEARPL